MRRLDTQRRRRGHDFLPPKALLKRIPALGATAKQDAADTVIWLHYFGVAGDWWITELDADEGYAFGYVRLANMPEFAEWGGVDLAELEALTVSLPVSVHVGYKVKADGSGEVVESVLKPAQPLTVVAVERDRHWTPVKFRDATIIPPEWFKSA
jgi:hypothetical protein